MRVSRIEFGGYRRLAKTGTSLDGPLTAFVGFNEAGKTSLLRALDWFTTGGALSRVDYNRSREPQSDDTTVVKVFYELDDEDKAAFAHVRMDNPPTSLVLHRERGGDRTYSFSPSPGRSAEPFERAAQRLRSATVRLARQFDAAVEGDEVGPNEWAETLGDALSDPDADWTNQWRLALQSLSDWLNETPAGRKKPRDSQLAALLNEVNDLQLHADEMVQRFATGEVQDLHDVIIAQQEAAIAFRLVQEVRDKLLAGYQDIMRMQV